MATKKSTRSKPAPAQATEEVDRQLARYRSMRDFSTTAEPSGMAEKQAGPSALPFVIQKHAATRLHYDFRLGWRGVLKSWACAKGPSYSTRDKRLAVQVEDHPMEYGGFEGTIPKGQYGGGTVLVWDQGTWEPVGDVDEGLEKGSLKFTLHGEKLKGRWTLVRMGGRLASESKPNWLLIKEHDGNERSADAPAITEEAPDSVVTGRSLEAVAEAEDHVWNSRPAEHPAPANRSRLRQKLDNAHLHGTVPKTKQAELGKKPKPPAKSSVQPASQQSTAHSWLEGAPSESMPGFIPPQLATAAARIPEGAGWLHELKLDGYRIQAHLRASGEDRKGKRHATLFTRSGLDWTHRMRAVARAVEQLPVGNAIVDGEVVVLDAQGGTSFSRLQAAFEKGEAATLTYFAFDLLHLDGHNLRGLPLHARKALLEPLVASGIELGHSRAPLLQFSQHLQLAPDEVYAHACALGAEGILSKNGDARYTSGRSGSWLKLKCTHRQEFVIAGLTPPKDGGAGLGSLLLGYYREGKLIHCGRCGTGFTQASARAVRKQLEPLRQAKPAYDGPLSREAKKDALWVHPELVCEVEFATWTADGSLRHAAFQGMRTDKPAAEVVAEVVLAEPELPRPDASALEAETSTRSSGEKPARKKPASRTTSRQEPSPSSPESPAKEPLAPAKSIRNHAGGSIRNRVGAKTGDAVGNVPVRLTHPDKTLDAPSGATKQQLADYFEAVAPAMLPHLAGRPVSIVRCPNGSGKPCFFQKHAAVGLPATLGSIPVPDRDNPKHSEAYIAVDTAEALAGLAQLGVLELHPWGSQASALEQPDRLILDLDPDESLPWSTIVDSAQAIRAFLKELQLETFVKTTGGKGLHVVAAIQPSAEWPDIRLFARGIALAIESSDPKLYLIKMTKAARKGRIFLDWMRNERGATAIAPWSPRARPGMRVAVPLGWDELAGGPPAFAVANFSNWRARLEPKNNPWAGMKPQPLSPEVLRTVIAQSGAAAERARK